MTGTPRIIASIEARMSASRLPGKVLLDVAGKPAITRLVDRLKACERLDGIVLATTDNPADDPLEHWAKDAGIPCFRGSEEDVLARVVGAQTMMESEIVVEVCGDTPLIDPGVIDHAVARFLKGGADVVSNTKELTWPQGIDAQVFRLSDLKWVADEIDDPAVREHVSLYFYEHPERYKIIHLKAPEAEHAPDLRLQMDYPEDLALIRAVYDELEPRLGATFGVPAVLDLLKRAPHLGAINAACEEKPVR